MSGADRDSDRAHLEPVFRLFRPILAGASLRERLIACFGAFVCLALTSIVSGLIFRGDLHLPLLLAPIGGSAVLLFAVPTSPLAQPWPIIGGNTISTLIGIGVANLHHDPLFAPAIALTVALAVMSFLRCLHPPAGAAALGMALGGHSVGLAGLAPAVLPFFANAVLLVALGWAFHRLTGRAYPHHPAPPANTRGTLDPPPQLRTGFTAQDIDRALERLGETFDIDRGDLDRLLREVELQSLVRSRGRLASADIMSRDVISIVADAAPEEARDLILRHGVRLLPVIDSEGKLAGTIGLRELAGSATRVGDLMSKAVTAAPEDDALALVPVLTDGRTHAVVVTDAEKRVLGLLTQTDLLVALSRRGPSGARS